MTNKAFSVQGRVRGPWRRYLDSLNPLRPDLHRYCCKLTGNVWDGEDLVQDTLMRVFSLLGKVDAKLENPRAYLIRTATNLWIDRVRRQIREQAILELEKTAAADDSSQRPNQETNLELRDASLELLQQLHPQERAALVLKDVYDYTLDETACLLKTSVGAVKSALHRSRGRMNDKLPKANFSSPSRSLVEAFMNALTNKDLEKLQSICASDLTVELVGGAELVSFEHSRSFFKHAHSVLPALGFGLKPRWEIVDYDDEAIIIGYRTMNDQEGINEIHRIEELDGKICKVRAYCFCPDTLADIGLTLNKSVIRRPIPYRSPSLPDIPGLFLRHWFKRS